VNDQNVKWVAVFRLGRRNETPVVRIGEAGHQRLSKREYAQRRIEIQLAGTTARGLEAGSFMCDPATDFCYRFKDIARARERFCRSQIFSFIELRPGFKHLLALI
jgi:hypothetical protein